MSLPLKTAGGAGPSLWLYLPLFGLGMLWGFSFSAAKIAISTGGHPAGIALWQAFGGALILFAVAVSRGKRPVIDRAHLRYYAASGLVGVAIPSTSIYVAAPHLPASIMAILVSTGPMMTYLFALLLRMERFERRRALGIVVGFGGVALLVGPSAALPDRAAAGWALVALIAPICYASQNIVATRLRPADSDSMALACGMLAVAATFLAAYVVPFDVVYDIAPPWDRTHAAILSLVLIAGLSQTVFFFVIGRAGPVFTSQVGYFVTLCGVVWGIVLFGERLDESVWISLALLLLGVALVSPKRYGPAPV
ncbi:DMT family transporter [Oceanibacterium hippocampi]|uniref:Putative inner membrane transporter yiJE n=1 Tax=Oceanibacterium hippocampi TaxID=745714 RepID=A0A1Y5TDQ3_9PROT|nr:DMT family transporter [Oceanibacterium hippocampi]SLN59593.1 putative inner membrane transporter yiJE [Oceanibacterium hippocampi]